ncbi:MAG: hypothetical protein K9M15_02495 [Candidatus Marinimicrobia bacterium]|nr:hypothetical protein [Candidatus Neomarinimicrobiota bacterium]
MHKKPSLWLVFLVIAMFLGLLSFENNCHSAEKSTDAKISEMLSDIAEAFLCAVENGTAEINTKEWENGKRILVRKGLVSFYILKYGVGVYPPQKTLKGFIFYLVIVKKISDVQIEWQSEEQINCSQNEKLCQKINALYETSKKIVKKRITKEKTKKMKKIIDSITTERK